MLLLTSSSLLLNLLLPYVPHDSLFISTQFLDVNLDGLFDVSCNKLFLISH